MQDESSVALASPWLTVEEAAHYIQQHPRTIYRAAGSGKLRSVRINGKGELRTKAVWLDQWLEQYARGGVDAAPAAPPQDVLAYVARRR